MFFIVPFISLILFSIGAFGQSCSHADILDHMRKTDPEIEFSLESIEAQMKKSSFSSNDHEYVIPTVIHVFHFGDENRLTPEQIASGMEILNRDMQGLNGDWGDDDPRFDSIRSKIDIHFCLAQRAPDGSPTTGVIYYEDSLAMYRGKDLYEVAWDNEMYFNIYMPKWVFTPGGLFTAFATYPNAANVRARRDGVHYSGVRFGYGEHSILDEGQEWASVITHEVGHWLNLRHTFDGGCTGSGDLIADTPPTLGGQIYTSGCNNQDLSCQVATNGSNYMDYNHDCKRMFTKGQTDRMLAALNLSFRKSLWSEDNLIATGCQRIGTHVMNEPLEAVRISPNPVSNSLLIQTNVRRPVRLMIHTLDGRQVFDELIRDTYELCVGTWGQGTYIATFSSGNEIRRERFVVNR